MRLRSSHGSEPPRRSTRVTRTLQLWRLHPCGILLSSTRKHRVIASIELRWGTASLLPRDEFTPFRGTEFKIPRFRFHDLPWPREVLRDLVEADVTLRVTLSYFIEPTASRRGWRQRYQYESHGLRFELQGPLESETDFIQRVNRQAQSEEAGQRPSSGGVDWFIGPNQRHQGSLHQDIWETSAANLADTGKIAIYPVGGWWKNNSRRDRVDRPVRYSLVVSLKTEEEGIDLYTPIATQVDTPVQVPVEIEL